MNRWFLFIKKFCSDEEIAIPKIASSVNISERSLSRLFKEYTGVFPTVYRKIARFRNSLESKLIMEKYNRLSDVGYESNYYDQSYFIKTYKQLTRKSPGDLYKSVEKFADGNAIFQFLKGIE